MQIIDLPLELWVEILTYVPKKCRQNNIWQICTSMREALKHPHFKDDFRLNLRAAHLDSEMDPVLCFQNNDRVFSEVILQDTTFGQGYEDFLSNVCECVEVLTIKYKYKNVTGSQLGYILGNCGNIKKLSLSLEQGFGVILNASMEIKEMVKKGLQSVETLVLSGPIEGRIDQFVELLDSMSKLKYLDMQKLDVFRSEEKQFYDALIPFISKHAQNLKGIIFQPDFKPENLKKYERLAGIEELKLEQFGATALQEFKWSQTEYSSFLNFIKSNCRLSDLRINSTEKLEWGTLMEIIKHHKGLKRLEVDFFSFFLSVEAGLLLLLPEIETIIFDGICSMDDPHEIWPQVDQENLIPTVNESLKELIISKFYSLYTDAWLSCDFKCLTRLEIRDSELEDEHVHLICEKLRLLEDLSITSALISDFSISGKPKRKGRIVVEKLKTAICDLQYLRILALDYNDKITSGAFEKLPYSKNLQHLSLEGCDRINDKAIVHLVSHCPNLRYLNVSYCSKIKDDSLRLICEKLSKLSCLKINELPALSTASFDYIGNLAKNLRYLHIKDYVKLPDVKDCAKKLFRKSENLRLIKLAHNETLHRIDSLEVNALNDFVR